MGGGEGWRGKEEGMGLLIESGRVCPRGGGEGEKKGAQKGARPRVEF